VCPDTGGTDCPTPGRSSHSTAPSCRRRPAAGLGKRCQKCPRNKDRCACLQPPQKCARAGLNDNLKIFLHRVLKFARPQTTHTEPLLSNSVLGAKERRDGRTKRRVSSSVRPFVRLSLCPLCLSGASIVWGGRTPMLHRNLRGRLKKI